MTAEHGVERTWMTRVEELLRELAPRVLGALVRRYGQFDACEDAMQEALLAASTQWVTDGVPDNPRGWLTTVASRRVVDEVRSETARRRREETAAALAGLSAGCAGPGAGIRRRRQPDAALPLLPSGGDPGLSGSADAAGRRWSDDSADRGRVPGAGSDDGPTDQPRQAADPRRWAPASNCRRLLNGPSGSQSCCTSCT